MYEEKIAYNYSMMLLIIIINLISYKFNCILLRTTLYKYKWTVSFIKYYWISVVYNFFCHNLILILFKWENKFFFFNFLSWKIKKFIFKFIIWKKKQWIVPKETILSLILTKRKQLFLIIDDKTWDITN